VLFIQMIGDPEVRRLQHFGLLPQGAMGSDREAMVGRDYYVAADETTKDFHARLEKIALERSVPGQGVFIISLGHPDTPAPLREAPHQPSGAPNDGARLN
jgi:hypothetical protein